ncbi:hypothetical protein B9Z55_006255 [Caenorhabditis nigoni]|uniref:Secreted protein n=1 Tax=Caenorhabditis nigoni TaxID=1611254 RepID=A0A2G5V4E6_9PELO|nr:hypothetical protein B9Z55_006255 [Caenorhabditis nigoni]
MIANKGLSLFILAALITVTSAQLMCQYGKSTQFYNNTIVYSAKNGPDKPIMCPGTFCMRVMGVLKIAMDSVHVVAAETTVTLVIMFSKLYYLR